MHAMKPLNFLFSTLLVLIASSVTSWAQSNGVLQISDVFAGMETRAVKGNANALEFQVKKASEYITLAVSDDLTIEAKYTVNRVKSKVDGEKVVTLVCEASYRCTYRGTVVEASTTHEGKPNGGLMYAEKQAFRFTDANGAKEITLQYNGSVAK
jgi:hypothetical protein